MSNNYPGCGSIAFHLVMVFLTGGIWLIVLIVIACLNSSKK